MTIIHASSTIIAAFEHDSADILNLDGHTHSDFGFQQDATAQFVAKNDGNMYRDGAAQSQFQIDDSTGDWVRPNTSGGAPYRFRYTGLTGDPLDGFTTAAVNVWASAATNYWWSITDTTIVFGGKSATFTIEVDAGGGTALESGTYTLEADREDN